MPDWRNLYEFWFGDITIEADYYKKNLRRWFYGDNLAFDRECEQFAPLLENFDIKKFSHWLNTPQGYVTLLILIDQIPRTIHRGRKKAYRFDKLAVALCLAALDKPVESSLNLAERIFLYMPLEHAEDLHLQTLSVQKFKELFEQSPQEVKEFTHLGLLKAMEHNEVIEKYGRFPHRNSILGRVNTASEGEYMRGFDKQF